jgi:uncharacterized protein (DUF1015 family)
MATVLPFKAIRPSQDKVHLVASRSVEGYQPHEIKERLSGNPFTFLHVINPDFKDGVKTKAGSPERLAKVKIRYREFIKNEILIHDTKACYYVYRQIKENHQYLGIIACTSIDDYLSGVIKIHEQTITQREEKLKEYLEVCEFNAEPVLFCYPNDQELDVVVADVSKGHPDYDFSTTDMVRHTLWVVSSDFMIQKISERFSTMPAIYIADGHHRSASSALLGKEKRIQKPDYSGTEPFNYYLGVFFAETQLKIYEYNRVVKDMHGLTVETLLQQLSLKFEVKPLTVDFYEPQQKHEMSMYIQNQWYSLMAKDGTYFSHDPVGSLDASILTEHVLSPIFDIHDLKTDARIGFVPGVKGANALKQQVDEQNAAVAFGLYPVTMDHLKWIADTNNIMPPKSTWVEPKMRSGLVIYSFED